MYYSFMPGMTHPRTGAYYSHDNAIYAMGVELAHMWGVPTLAATYGMDATYPGWELGMNGCKSAMLCALCGAETGSGMGLLQGSTLLYPEALVLDSELYHSVLFSTSEINMDSEHMALDVIKAVGPRGHYLREKHTREHFRKLNFSEIVHVSKPGGGYYDPIDRAREKTDWILENHHPEPLSIEQQTDINRILKAAENELG